jgi:hypothetical protein
MSEWITWLPSDIALMVLEYMIPPTVWVVYQRWPAQKSPTVHVCSTKEEAHHLDLELVRRQGGWYTVEPYTVKDWWKPVYDQYWGKVISTNVPLK